MRYLGLLAAARGRMDLASVHLDAAVADNTRIRARPHTALALHDHAALTGDRELAARAIEAYTALGLDVLAERAARLAG